MKNYRLSSGTKEHYTSLADLREAWGMKPIVKKTSDDKTPKTPKRRKICI